MIKILLLALPSKGKSMSHLEYRRKNVSYLVFIIYLMIISGKKKITIYSYSDDLNLNTFEKVSDFRYW